jgi:spore maturation protein CgeB
MKINMNSVTKLQDACRICGSMRGSFIVEKGYGEFASKWFSCDGCQSARMDPYPNDLELTRYYNSKYLDMDLRENSLGVSHKLRFSDSYKQTVFKEYSFSCSDVALDVKEICDDKYSVLDYGCANGIFLNWLFQCGCSKDNLYGFDIAIDMVDEAVSNGFKCVTDISKLKGLYFDLITAWDLIEHVPHPKSVVRQMRSFLRDGGKILVQTPNFGDLAFLMGDVFAHYLVIEHLHLFSRASLIKLFEDEGFVCLKQASFGANAPTERVAEPYKTAYDKLVKRFDHGATQVLLFGLEG